MITINIYDYLQLFDGNIGENNKLVNLRGTNGSGKSSVPFSFINSDKDTFELTYQVDGKERVIATVCPNEKWLFLGAYRTKCGGLDYYKTVEQTVDSLNLVFRLPFNILLEGVIASTIFSTYADLFNQININHERDVIVASLLPPLNTCLQRIQSRNGGKEVKCDQVEFKYNTVKKNVEKFRNAGLNSIELDNSQIELKDTKNWFLDAIGMSVDKTSTHDTEIVNLTTNKLFLPDKRDIECYEWYPFYKEPNDSVEVDWEYFDRYWNFIAERMNIYWKRVVMKESAPWTDDPILRDYKFTNILRDMDRLSIYVRNNILSKIDEPCDDLEERKKDVLFNIMIFRLFVKIESYECIGFIEQKYWDKQWPAAVEKLRERRRKGEAMFTDAYYVFGLHTASPSPDNHDKTENAINLIDNFWRPMLDEIYEKVTTLDMKDLLNYLSGLCCVGRFTAYEYCCDFGMITRYCTNHLVNWTNDSYTNVGPGAERGIRWIFKNKGNLSDFECIIYLRAIWKHELQRLGTYDQFVRQLPEEMHKDVDLRVIEHCLCETQKYNKALTGTGRPKVKFTPKTKNLDELRV